MYINSTLYFRTAAFFFVCNIIICTLIYKSVPMYIYNITKIDTDYGCCTYIVRESFCSVHDTK